MKSAALLVALLAVAGCLLVNRDARADNPASEVVNTAQQRLESLQQIGEGLKHVRYNALQLVGEVERRRFTMIGEPELVKPIPEPKLPDANTIADLGKAEPPRKKWLDIYMNNIESALSFIQEEAAGIKVGISDQSVTSWHEVQRSLQNMMGHAIQLESLTGGPSYDNIAIGREALNIYDDTTSIENPWKTTVSIVKSQIK